MTIFQGERKHIIICGCPRSGTTLLYDMMAATLQGGYVFPIDEIGAVQVKRKFHRIVTKRPRDVFELDRIVPVDPYATKLIVCIRDPRAIMCSKHYHSAGQFKIGWKQILKTGSDGPRSWEKPGLKDFLERCVGVTTRWSAVPVYYEQLVTQPHRVQEALAEILGLEFEGCFADWTERLGTELPEGMSGMLNGLRPPEASRIDSWRQHPQHIRKLLRQNPEIQDWLEYLGYEKDAQWQKELED